MPLHAGTRGWDLKRAELDVLVAADKRRKKVHHLKIIIWREQEFYDDAEKKGLVDLEMNRYKKSMFGE